MVVKWFTSLNEHRRGALLFFKIIHKISSSHGAQKNCWSLGFALLTNIVMTQAKLPQSLCFLQGSLSMSYTHTIDMSRYIQANDKIITLLKMDCTMAEKGHHKNDYNVYCVRNNIKNEQNIFMSGLKLIISGPKIYVGVPNHYVGFSTYNVKLIMSGSRLIMFELWDYYVGAPICYVGVPTCHVGAQR